MEQIINVTTEPIELKIKVESEPLVIDKYEAQLRRWLNNEPTDFEVPDGVTAIKKDQFKESSVVNVTLSDSVASIGDNAFDRCKGLNSINIPDGVQSIGSEAFYGCSSLRSIEIPDSVESIGYAAFDRCTNLWSVRLPENLTEIPYACFQNNSMLSSITVPQSVQTVDDNAFGYTTLSKFTFPENVETIGAGVFQNCRDLGTVTFLRRGEFTVRGGFGARYNPTIRCYADTYAYQWATENGYTVEVIPDV